MEVIHKAKIRPVREHVYEVEVLDRVDETRLFFQKKQEWEKQNDEERYADIRLAIWYRKRTAKQNRLQFAICQRILLLDEYVGCTVNEIHNGLKAQYYPRRLNRFTGLDESKDGDELTTVEYSKVVEKFNAEAIMLGADVWDIWILFTEWRFQQAGDPLEGTYGSRKAYRDLHPCCEACGVCLVSKAGEHRGEIADILTTARAGETSDWNWLMLCPRCHRFVMHQKGWNELIKLYEWIKEKVKRALLRKPEGVLTA